MKPVNEARLQKVLEYIQKVEKETGYSPTYRDIKEKIGHKSLNSVYQDVQRLRDRGLIREDVDPMGGIVPDEKLGAGDMKNIQVVGEMMPLRISRRVICSR